MAKPKKRKRRKKARPKKRTRSLYQRMVIDAGVVCLTALIGAAVLFIYVARDLPDTGNLWSSDSAQRITLLADDGSPLLVQGAGFGEPIRLAELPVHLPEAILAVEDRNFYHHFGVNPVSILRALSVNARSGEIVQGGSTITQQLAKNVFLSPDRTFKRKLQELLLAFWLEQKFSKQEILTLYLNRIYFGAGAYGVDAASYRYFGKSARNVSVSEAAILAGLIKAPSRYAPTSNPVTAGKRARLVIDQMVDAGFLTRQDADAAVREPVALAGSPDAAAPYFVDYALQEARKLASGIDANLIVRTSFNRNTQIAAEMGLIAGVALAPDDLKDVQTALVILDGEGAVKAMIGGRDYRESQFNRATQARRQPGSAFKPIVYLAALNVGYGPNDIVLDAPVSIGAWSPANYNDKYFGEATLRDGLARSMNAAAVRVQEHVGRDQVRQAARDLGWTGALNPGPALALGTDAISPLQLAGIYAPFMNGGFRIAPHVVERIETDSGELIYERKGAFIEQAIAPSVARKLDEMLQAVVETGTGGAAEIPGYRSAGKTGTTQDNRDAWFAGYAGNLVGVVWVGHDDNSPMDGVTGGRAPALIWREAMARALPPIAIATLAAPTNDPIAEILAPDMN
ncbi:MAG: PBP1A family penicillin-binding protein [Marinicaulis sp.]|nr:PBP1A family penicillin-binding protein [Marinicaulis sp.]